MTKIIFVDINARYYNPTRELLPSLLALSTELHLYGPGYVDSRTLNGGLRLYLDRYAADLIVLTEYAAFASLILVAMCDSRWARARQFADTLAAMADRSFAGGRWVDGRYTVIRRKA